MKKKSVAIISLSVAGIFLFALIAYAFGHHQWSATYGEPISYTINCPQSTVGCRITVTDKNVTWTCSRCGNPAPGSPGTIHTEVHSKCTGKDVISGTGAWKKPGDDGCPVEDPTPTPTPTRRLATPTPTRMATPTPTRPV